MPNCQHHTNLEVKVSQRRWLIAQFDNPPRILDCFCGPGQMWEQAYEKPGRDRYLGLDIETYNDERMTIVCDNRRYLRHVQVDLSAWDIFDLDAFGHPGEQLAIITHRLGCIESRKPFGFTITLTKILTDLNRTPRPILTRAGFSPHWGTKVQAENADAIWNQFFTHCFNEAHLTEVARQQHTEKGVVYYAIFVKPI